MSIMALHFIKAVARCLPPFSIVPKEASCHGVSSYQDDPKIETGTISWNGGLSPVISEQKPEVQVQ